MVGGKVIEIVPKGEQILRLWCVDGWDECAVYVERPDDGVLPGIGDTIWWQSGKVYFDGDKRTLFKTGNSHDPRQAARTSG